MTMPHYYVERRRANPSFTVPFVFFSLEVLLGGLILSLIELTPNPYEWSVVSYALGAGWIIYSAKKLVRVLLRQRKRHYSHYRVDDEAVA